MGEQQTSNVMAWLCTWRSYHRTMESGHNLHLNCCSAYEIRQPLSFPRAHLRLLFTPALEVRSGKPPTKARPKQGFGGSRGQVGEGVCGRAVCMPPKVVTVRG
jgi:hypothetical protein